MSRQQPVIKNVGGGGYKLNTLVYYRKALERLIRFVNEEYNVKEKDMKLQYLEMAWKWAEYREKALKQADILTWLRLFKYRKYYFNFKSWLADFLMLRDYAKENQR